jgi:transposase-like protein/predicted phosphodiesterase
MAHRKPTQEEFEEALQEGGNVSKAATLLGVSAPTLYNWIRDGFLSRPEGDAPGKRKLTEALNVSGTLEEADLKDPGRLLREHGLAEDDYDIVKVDLAQRENSSAKDPKIAKSISVTVAPKLELPQPAFGGRPITIKPHKRTKRTSSETELVLILSDYHAPYVDWQLHEASLQLIAENQPHRIIVNGDLVDFPTVGRHRTTTTRCQASASECIEAGGRVLADLRSAAPDDCHIDLIPGNHDAWLNNKILGEVSAIYDLTAYGDTKPVWSFENLFRLEELGINLVGEPDTWPHSSIALTPHLVVHHGDVARKGSGASPLASMSGKDFAEIHGHTHRQSLVGRTVWLADGSTRIYQGGECGAMCVMEASGFPTYTRHPDWQPGFASVELELDATGNPSGEYSMDLATWQNSKLMWRGEIFS